MIASVLFYVTAKLLVTNIDNALCRSTAGLYCLSPIVFQLLSRTDDPSAAAFPSQAVYHTVQQRHRQQAAIAASTAKNISPTGISNRLLLYAFQLRFCACNSPMAAVSCDLNHLLLFHCYHQRTSIAASLTIHLSDFHCSFLPVFQFIISSITKRTAYLQPSFSPILFSLTS